MTPPTKKPAAAWIMHIAAIIGQPVALLYAMLFAMYSLDTGPGEGIKVQMIGGAILLVLLFLWSLVIAITLHRRMWIARPLGGAVIGVLILIGLYSIFTNLSADFRTGEYSSGGIFGHTVVVAVECYWLYAFALSGKARMYFVKKSKDAIDKNS